MPTVLPTEWTKTGRCKNTGFLSGVRTSGTLYRGLPPSGGSPSQALAMFSFTSLTVLLASLRRFDGFLRVLEQLQLLLLLLLLVNYTSFCAQFRCFCETCHRSRRVKKLTMSCSTGEPLGTGECKMKFAQLQSPGRTDRISARLLLLTSFSFGAVIFSELAITEHSFAQIQD
uniref:(northern house mosquito) hypothetical protein n=1 Tax=Culex pipiens TaxID=7175 RepID=A0A8D8KPX9_CULPI